MSETSQFSENGSMQVKHHGLTSKPRSQLGSVALGNHEFISQTNYNVCLLTTDSSLLMTSQPAQCRAK